MTTMIGTRKKAATSVVRKNHRMRCIAQLFSVSSL